MPHCQCFPDSPDDRVERWTVKWDQPLDEGCMDLVQTGLLAAALRAVTHRTHTCLDQHQSEGRAWEGSNDNGQW